MPNLQNIFTLPLQEMAIPLYASPSRQDVEVGGRILFQNFIHEEMLHEGLPEDAIEVQNPPPDVYGDANAELYANSTVEDQASVSALLSTPDGFNNQTFIGYGRNIRVLADEFATSHQRKLLREQADQVDLGSINAASFNNMLTELFRNGIDRYCIVALFYFCSDVLIRCVKAELRILGSKLFFWALDFLIQNVCKWVYDHGGWVSIFL